MSPGNVVCGQCGAPLRPGIRFCEECGNPVVSPAVPQEPVLTGDDGDTDLLLGYAMDLDAALLYEEAVRAYGRVLARDPGRIEAIFNRGLDYFYLSRYGEAMPDFEKYLGQVPDDAFALKYLAISCMETGHTEMGRDLMEKARSIDPGIDEK